METNINTASMQYNTIASSAMKADPKSQLESTAQQVVSVGDATADIFLGLNLSRAARHGKGGTRVAVLHVKDVRDGLLAPRRELSEFELSCDAQVDRYFLRVGDVVVTARGTVLKSALVLEEHVGVVATSNLIVVRATKALRAELLLAFLRNKSTQAALLAQTVGDSLPTLNVGAVARLKLAVPPQEEQEMLARLIRSGEVQYAVALEAARLCRETAHETVARTVRLRECPPPVVASTGRSARPTPR